MPALFIDSCSQIKTILEASEFLPSHNWLISYLECYDTSGWDGSEKWENTSLILTDEELKKDVYLRDMQFIWGVFSAIPKEYAVEDIDLSELPTLENSNYMANYIVPQHPLAFLEISVWDGSYTFICSRDENLLEPFYTLPYKVIDAEADNKITNKELCRIQDILRSIVPDVSDVIANEIQWKCWHSLLRDRKSEVSDNKLEDEIRKVYKEVSNSSYRFWRCSIWNPYDQK